MKFLTQTVANEYFARATATTVAVLKGELAAAIKLGRGNGNDVFENVAAYELSRNGFEGEIRVLPCGKAERVSTIRLDQCGVRYFVNAEHLARLVATDAKNHDLRMYIPMALNHPLVDAWCIGTVGGKWTVVGLQMTVAKLLHPIAGEDVAQEHFNAIHDALAQHQFPVQKAAWVVFVVPAAHFSLFPYQYAKVATGEEPRKAGLVWPHTQAKLAVQLDEGGKPPANAGGMRNMRARSTAIELSEAVTVDEICKLHNMGPTRAAQLLSVLRDTDESKTMEDFLDYLEDSHKTLAGVLKHERNQGRWTYRGQVWSQHAPARTAVRPKRDPLAEPCLTRASASSFFVTGTSAPPRKRWRGPRTCVRPDTATADPHTERWLTGTTVGPEARVAKTRPHAPRVTWPARHSGSQKTTDNRLRHESPSSGSGSWARSTSLSKAGGRGLSVRVLDSYSSRKRRRPTDGAPASAALRGVENLRRAAAKQAAVWPHTNQSAGRARSVSWPVSRSLLAATTKRGGRKQPSRRLGPQPSP